MFAVLALIVFSTTGKLSGSVVLVEENAIKHVLIPTGDIGIDWQGGSEPFVSTAVLQEWIRKGYPYFVDFLFSKIVSKVQDFYAEERYVSKATLPCRNTSRPQAWALHINSDKVPVRMFC